MFISYVETKFVDHELMDKRKKKLGPPSAMKRRLALVKFKNTAKAEVKPKTTTAKTTER